MCCWWNDPFGLLRINVFLTPPNLLFSRIQNALFVQIKQACPDF